MQYQGGCQCGAVRYRVEAALDQPVTCNCSRCQRLGSVLVFAPRSAFVLEQGAENLTDYQFNKHVIHHLFCKTCGIESYALGQTPDGAEMVAINVNCLDGVEPREIAAHAFAHDGRAL
ncbi:GFA family protein [Gemmobacter serpentinus]|uniref:GFA family protein n=1 Tax=Gemmobacter serpentinus TaxID=2652247 RepID=UPI00124C8AAD|nr:GFA family protein [Gemmobacter serpentinus]